MKYIEQIAYHLGRRDEVPNQELAKMLADNNDVEGLDEMAGYLFDKNKSVASDCLKVLYEAGYIKPELTAKYIEDYLKLLTSKNNRMVWGAMIAIWNVAAIEHQRIFEVIERIMHVTEKGTTITHVTGIKVMLVLAKIDKKYYDHLYPTLIRYLRECRPIDFGKRVEDYMVIFNADNKQEILEIVHGRLDGLNNNQYKRVKKALKQVGVLLP